MPILNPSEHAEDVQNYYRSTIGLPQAIRDELTRKYIEQRRRLSFSQRLDSIQDGALREQQHDIPANERSYGKHPYPRQVSLMAAKKQYDNYRHATKVTAKEIEYTDPVVQEPLTYESAVNKGRIQLILGFSLICSSVCGITMIVDALNR